MEEEMGEHLSSLAKRGLKADWRDSQIDRADNVFAAGFRDRTRTAYRQCRTSADLHALSKKCWRERDEAVRMANRYSNFTTSGTHRYDAYSMLADDAENMAKELWKKARRIEGGEEVADVMPFLAALTA